MKNFLSFAYRAFSKDLKFIIDYFKDFWYEGHLDWIGLAINLIMLFIVGFFCIVFPKTTIAIFLVSWRLYSRAVYDNEDDE